jgi:pyrimidine-nucleoside phosphorylase
LEKPNIKEKNMRAVDVIAKKRDGGILSKNEIEWFINEYTHGDLPDYQASAFLMAVLIRGMNTEEITNLTLTMANSGDVLDLSDVAEYVVDKHSSGGVGDKVTLVALPLVSSCGVHVAKMSGRGLGFTGGTLDKMESIRGFNTDLSEEQLKTQGKEIGLALSGQTRALAPADGKLYALRDVTATVPSIPLIAASIMSKKIAAGANGIVLDVKVGSGAFMKTVAEAQELAHEMVGIGKLAGRDVVALIADMNQPLGYAVGNSLEVAEAIEALNGGGPQDLHDHCLEVAAQMLRLAGLGRKWVDIDETKQVLTEKLENGEALSKFRQMVEAQGGDVRMVDDPAKLPQAPVIETLYADQGGYIVDVQANEIAWAAFSLGAGREKKDDPIDLSVGVKINVKVGDKVHRGQPIATVHAKDAGSATLCRQELKLAIYYSDEPVPRPPHFHGIVK